MSVHRQNAFCDPQKSFPSYYPNIKHFMDNKCILWLFFFFYIKWNGRKLSILSVFEQQFVMKYGICMSLAAPYTLYIDKGNSLCVSATKKTQLVCLHVSMKFLRLLSVLFVMLTCTLSSFIAPFSEALWQTWTHTEQLPTYMRNYITKVFTARAEGIIHSVLC